MGARFSLTFDFWSPCRACNFVIIYIYIYIYLYISSSPSCPYRRRCCPVSVRPSSCPSRRRRPSFVRPSRRVSPIVAVVVLCSSVRPVVRPVVVVRSLSVRSVVHLSGIISDMKPCSIRWIWIQELLRLLRIRTNMNVLRAFRLRTNRSVTSVS